MATKLQGKSPGEPPTKSEPGRWSADDKLKQWLLGVLLFSYMSWLLVDLNPAFRDAATLATLVSLVAMNVLLLLLWR